MNAAFGERLKAERLRLGHAPANFGTLCGVSRTTQFAYEAGDRTPDASYLMKAHQLGVDVTFVLTGEASGSGSQGEFVVVRRYAVAASAGPGSVAVEEDDLPDGLSFNRRWLAKRGLNPNNLRVIDVVGESMLPRLNDGDTVLVDISETTPKSGRAYVLRQGEELLVKYCQLLPDGILRVSSANPSYPTYDIDLSRTDGVSILGRVRASTHEW